MLCNSLLPKPLGYTQLNIVAFVINFVAVAVIFRRFLWHGLIVACGNLWNTIKTAFLAFCVYYVCNILVNMFILRVMPSFYNVNDSAIGEMTAQSRVWMTLCVVLLVPVVEETLYRGVLFGRLYTKNQWFGYIASVAIFAAIHVIGYVGSYSTTQLLLCFLQYLPAGVALAWAYAKAETIWASILMHMVVNLIGMTVA